MGSYSPYRRWVAWGVKAGDRWLYSVHICLIGLNLGYVAWRGGGYNNPCPQQPDISLFISMTACPASNLFANIAVYCVHDDDTFLIFLFWRLWVGRKSVSDIILRTCFKGTVAWYGFLAYSVPSCLDSMNRPINHLTLLSLLSTSEFVCQTRPTHYIKSHEKLCGKIKKIFILTYFT